MRTTTAFRARKNGAGDRAAAPQDGRPGGARLATASGGYPARECASGQHRRNAYPRRRCRGGKCPRDGLIPRQKSSGELSERVGGVPLDEVRAARQKPQVELRTELLGERRAPRGLAAILLSKEKKQRHRAPGKPEPRRLA